MSRFHLHALRAILLHSENLWLVFLQDDNIKKVRQSDLASQTSKLEEKLSCEIFACQLFDILTAKM